MPKPTPQTNRPSQQKPPPNTRQPSSQKKQLFRSASLSSKLKKSRPSKIAIFFFSACILVSGTVVCYFSMYRSRMDDCGQTVVDASHAVQEFAKTYGYHTGQHVDNLWPRLYLFMEKEYSQHLLTHKPTRVCPETGQEYDCKDTIPEPGAPVILCKFPPHKASTKVIN